MDEESLLLKNAEEEKVKEEKVEEEEKDEVMQAKAYVVGGGTGNASVPDRNGGSSKMTTVLEPIWLPKDTKNVIKICASHKATFALT
eukprot:1096858-Amorphochlora_amoeboformis.AAC.1